MGTPGAEDRLLDLLLLDWSTFDRADLVRGADLLRAEPDLATASVWTMAACGRADELARTLAAEPDLVDRSGGPHGWAPLLHVCFSRLALVAPELGGDPVATVEVLLAAGADPEAGFLWEGLVPPFTALTGAFGGGERGEPPHPQARELAGLLLDAGADPDDGQTLYDRIFTAPDDHLEVLLPRGLGRGRGGRWRARLGERLDPPEVLVGDHLCFAAQEGYAARVRLLLEHGVDPSRPGTHPVLGGRTPLELAWRHGHPDVVVALEAAGGRGHVTAADRLVAAALAGDEHLVSTRSADPGVVAEAVATRPDAPALAVGRGTGPLRLLLELGLPVDAHAGDGRTALHAAAWVGDAATCRWLLRHGADRAAVDAIHGGTPAQWAGHAGHARLAAELAAP